MSAYSLRSRRDTHTRHDSGPVASTLVGLFRELALGPDHAEKIYDEINDLDVCNTKLLSTLPHLNGVIAEALRLYPALPIGGNRKATDHGVTIGGTYIPPLTTIVAPRFSISRSEYIPAAILLQDSRTLGEDCFTRGQDFVPERWYEHPDMIRNKAGYAPFGTSKREKRWSLARKASPSVDIISGHHSRLGRVLASDSMRLVTARLVKRYHISLARGETGNSAVKDLRDQVTSNPGRLLLAFSLREKKCFEA